MPSFHKLGMYAFQLFLSNPQRLRRGLFALRRFFVHASRLLMRSWKVASVLALVAVLLFIIYSDLTKAIVIIEEFKAPSNLSDEVISSQAITRKFYDQLDSIRRLAVTDFREQGQFALASEADSFKVSYSGLETTWGAFISYVAELLNIDRPRIVGTVRLQPESMNELAISVRRVGFAPKEIKTSLDKLDEGLRECAEYVYQEIDPYILANYYYQEKRWEEGARLARYCLRHERTAYQKWAYNLQGLILARREARKEAISMYRRALDLDSQFPAPYVNLGLLFSSRSSRLANYYYSKALALQPRSYIALRNKALLHMAKRQYHKAKLDLERSLAINPRSAETHGLLASVYVLTKEDERSKEHFEHARDLLPASADPHIVLAAAYVQLGKMAAAKLKLEEGLRVEPDNQEARALLALLQADEGACPEARGNARKALPSHYVAKDGDLASGLAVAQFADLIAFPYEAAQNRKVAEMVIAAENICARSPSK